MILSMFKNNERVRFFLRIEHDHWNRNAITDILE